MHIQGKRKIKRSSHSVLLLRSYFLYQDGDNVTSTELELKLQMKKEETFVKLDFEAKMERIQRRLSSGISA